MSTTDKAREIIRNISYITIATAGKDEKPWNTPVYSAYDASYTFFWYSDEHSQHSRNIAENSSVFLVIYDSTAPEGTGTGVYIQATAEMITDPDEIVRALEIMDRRAGKSHDNRQADDFLGNMPRRVYKAVPEKVWINDAGDVNGNYIDVRKEITL